MSFLRLQVGADHLDVKIDSVVAAMAALFAVITGRRPAFRVRRRRRPSPPARPCAVPQPTSAWHNIMRCGEGGVNLPSRTINF